MELVLQDIPLDELQQIEQNYNQGVYGELEKGLQYFLENKIERIKYFMEEKFCQPLPLEIAVRLMILDDKTVNTKLDNLDQIREMEKEKWIRHQVNNTIPADVILEEWVVKHARAWRIHRAREILYLFGRNKEKYLSEIQARLGKKCATSTDTSAITEAAKK